MGKIKNNKRGSLTILFVIIILVAVVVITGFLNISMRTIAQNEIQGIMDESGVVALRQSVDENSLRLEKIYINESMARQNYINLINNSISSGPGKMVKNYTINKVQVYPPNHPNLRNLGIPNGQRDQYFIESIISVDYMKPVMGEGVVNAGIGYFDYITGNQKKQFEHSSDSKKAIVLRSVSRLVLR